MKLDRFIRVAIAVVILLVFIVATGALLFISESALNVWDRLRAGPPALLYAYVAIMALIEKIRKISVYPNLEVPRD